MIIRLAEFCRFVFEQQYNLRKFGQGRPVAGRKVPEMVLNPVQMFVQQLSATRCAAEKTSNRLKCLGIDLEILYLVVESLYFVRSCNLKVFWLICKFTKFDDLIAFIYLY
jgi:hypothetical protein